MPNYKDGAGYTLSDKAAYPAYGTPSRLSVFSMELDFAKVKAERAAKGSTALAVGDTLRLCKIPAGTTVLDVSMLTLVVESGAATGTISVGKSDNTGADGARANGVAIAFIPAKIATVANELRTGNRAVSCAVDTNLELAIATAVPTTAVVQITVTMVDCKHYTNEGGPVEFTGTQFGEYKPS